MYAPLSVAPHPALIFAKLAEADPSISTKTISQPGTQSKNIPL
jgi:hypothetical protein